jgi:3-phenylpropionate/trans-cinnamate dioxygenase ferredoxin subunit
MTAADPNDQWHHVCGIADLVDNSALTLPVQPPVAIYRVNGSFYATDDTCTHATFSLANGYVDEDCTVECDLHLAKFCIKTGQVLKGPAAVALAIYPVRIDDHAVYVNLASRRSSEA